MVKEYGPSNDGSAPVRANEPSGLTSLKARPSPRAADIHAVDLLAGERARLAAIVDSSYDAIISKALDGTITSWNAAAERIYGYSEDEVVGRPISIIIPPNRLDEATRIYARLGQGERLDKVETERVRKDGRSIPVSLTYSPIKDAAGSVIGISGISRDITERKQAEQALRDSEQRFRGTFEQAAVGMAHVGLDGSWLVVNDRLCQIVGYAREELSTKTFQDITHPDDLEADLNYVRRLLAGEIKTYSMEKRYIRKDGSVVWINLTVSIARDPVQGQFRYFIAVIEDIDARKQAEEALQEQTRTLETINRINTSLAAELDLEKLVQAVTDAGTELTGAQFGAFFYNARNEQGETYTLYTLSGVPREAFAEFPMPRNTSLFGPTFRGERIIRVDDVTKDPRYGKNPPYHGMPEGHLPVRSYLAVPVISRTGEVIGGLFFGHPMPGVFTERAEHIIAGVAGQAAIGIDNARLYRELQVELAQRKRAEERQQLLLDELNHRVKNTLTVVLSIASQTIRHSQSLANFNKSFTGRLRSLSDAHALLTQGHWGSASLRELVETALRPHRLPNSACVGIQGEDIALQPAAALALNMVLHELATNAAKYGALSTPSGTVAVKWDLERSGKEYTLQFSWQETGGPKTCKPARRGFGTQLIEFTLAHEFEGAADLRYAEEGFCCKLTLPWDEETRSVRMAS